MMHVSEVFYNRYPSLFHPDNQNELKKRPNSIRCVQTINWNYDHNENNNTQTQPNDERVLTEPLAKSAVNERMGHKMICRFVLIIIVFIEQVCVSRSMAKKLKWLYTCNKFKNYNFLPAFQNI